MGNASLASSSPAAAFPVSSSHFSPAQLERLWARFVTHAHGDPLLLTKREFHRALFSDTNSDAPKGSHLLDRVFDLYDVDQDGSVQFGEFVQLLSALSPLATFHEKQCLAFRVYDLNADGKIDRGELGFFLKMSLDEAHIRITPSQFEHILDQTFSQCQRSGDHAIYQPEFDILTDQFPHVLCALTVHL